MDPFAVEFNVTKRDGEGVFRLANKRDRPIRLCDGTVILHTQQRRRYKSTRSRRWQSDRPVEPGAGRWKLAELGDDPQEYRVPPPPPDDSPETKAELEELRAMTQNRSQADIDEILRWSVHEPSLATHWSALADQLCVKYKLSPPAGGRVYHLLCQAMYCTIIACWANKWRYLRVRPDELDSGVDVSVIPVPQHPAYPSGHSAVAGAAAGTLSQIFPDDAPQIDAMAEESGISRMKAGIHYRSDHTAGIELGRKIARDLLREAAGDGAPPFYRLQP